MSSEPVVRIRGLGKRYERFASPSRRLLALLGGPRRSQAHWALRGVELEVRPGETVGLLGRNGSGKSTLLQMVCGTLEPTEGSVEVRGRVAALLELGAGFNPEFSGRENVFLNASMLGLSRAETERHFQAIVDFADIGDYLDEPVRTYSSGMFVRLAFAVAVAVEPDLLVVDEALAVGDEAFQRKCFARIEQLKARGAAILFVSHATAAVVQLCDRAVLLDAGEVLAIGAPKAVVAAYQKVLYGAPERRAALLAELRAGQWETAPGSGVAAPAKSARFDPGLVPESTVHYESRGARIESPVLVDSEGRPVNVLAPGECYRYRFRIRFDQTARFVHFGMLIKSTSGVELCGVDSHPHGEGVDAVPAGSVVDVAFPFRASLLPGTYFLNAGCVGWLDGEGETYLHRIVDALAFRIEATGSPTRRSGFFDLALEPACEYAIGAAP
jgi:lipopolysaccharide transport system ATP-binding protein